MQYALTINGQERQVDVAPGTPLLWVIRDALGMTGTKFGCGVAACGACTVNLDGYPVRSCQITIDDLDGGEVVTIEGMDSPQFQAVQTAWRELDVAQCGYCQSGQIMQATGLLTDEPTPDDQTIEDSMLGNACRCAAYPRIRAAVRRAADILQEG